MSAFVESALREFRAQKSLADRAMAQVSDAQLHQSLDPNTNSIAVIVKHMAGNMISRWTNFLTSDGEKPDRNRDGEFEDDLPTRELLMRRWEQGWQRVFDAIGTLSKSDLERTITIRNQPMSAMDAVVRQVSHYGYHVGQIVQVARIHANDQWSTLTIPRGQSKAYNAKLQQSPPERGRR